MNFSIRKLKIHRKSNVRTLVYNAKNRPSRKICSVFLFKNLGSVSNGVANGDVNVIETVGLESKSNHSTHVVTFYYTSLPSIANGKIQGFVENINAEQ